MRRAVLVATVLACGGCGSLLETDLPASTSYVLAPAPAASTGVARVRRRSVDRAARPRAGTGYRAHRGAEGSATRLLPRCAVGRTRDRGRADVDGGLVRGPAAVPQRHLRADACLQRVCARRQRARFPGRVRERQRRADRARDDSRPLDPRRRPPAGRDVCGHCPEQGVGQPLERCRRRVRNRRPQSRAGARAENGRRGQLPRDK